MKLAKDPAEIGLIYRWKGFLFLQILKMMSEKMIVRQMHAITIAIMMTELRDD